MLHAVKIKVLNGGEVGNQILNIAHRGSRFRSPENTLASFHRAISEGADYLELDVRLTGDGHVVVAHDARLNRTSNGSGRIRRQELKQLKSLDFGNWFHQDFKNETMPTLEEVLETFPSTGLNIEIKAKSLFDLSTARALIKLLKNTKKRPLIISSFNPIILLYFKVMYQGAPTGYLLESKKFLWVTNWLHPSFLHPRADMVDDSLINYCRQKGMGILAWTVNNRDAIKFCFNKNINGVITDWKESNI